MGSKYTNKVQSGFNAAPPPDDGSLNPSNLISWSGVKTKLADPVLNLVQAMNTALVAALDFGGRVVGVDDTATVADHMRTIECNAPLHALLPDAATIGAGYTVGYKNTSTGTVRIGLTTGTDTIDGVVNPFIYVAAGGFVSFKCKGGGNGYYTLQSGAAATVVDGVKPSITYSIGSSALTLIVNPQAFSFRSPTLNDGTMNIRGVTAAHSITIANGKTAGTTAAVPARILVGVMDVGDGTVEVFYINYVGSGKFLWNEEGLITTLAAGFDTVDTPYSDTARANLPYRLLGCFTVTEAVAGSWDTAPSLVISGGGLALQAMINDKARGVIPLKFLSAGYTTDETDNGCGIIHPSSDTNPRTFTINSNANVPYEIGTAIMFSNQNGAGDVTITVLSDVLRLVGAGTTGARTLTANGRAIAVKVGATEWDISGINLT
jgi:hypothetical protein